MFQEILKTEVAKTCFFHSELRNAASAQKFLLFESVQSDYKANKEYITNPTGQLIIAPKWNIIAKMYDNQACPHFRKFWKTLFYPSLEIVKKLKSEFFSRSERPMRMCCSPWFNNEKSDNSDNCIAFYTDFKFTNQCEVQSQTYFI